MSPCLVLTQKGEQCKNQASKKTGDLPDRCHLRQHQSSTATLNSITESTSPSAHQDIVKTEGKTAKRSSRRKATGPREGSFLDEMAWRPSTPQLSMYTTMPTAENQLHLEHYPQMTPTSRIPNGARHPPRTTTTALHDPSQSFMFSNEGRATNAAVTSYPSDNLEQELETILVQAKQWCGAMMAQTEQQCEAMVAQTEQKCEMMVVHAEQKCQEMVTHAGQEIQGRMTTIEDQCNERLTAITGQEHQEQNVVIGHQQREEMVTAVEQRVDEKVTAVEQECQRMITDIAAAFEQDTTTINASIQVNETSTRALRKNYEDLRDDVQGLGKILGELKLGKKKGKIASTNPQVGGEQVAPSSAAKSKRVGFVSEKPPSQFDMTSVSATPRAGGEQVASSSAARARRFGWVAEKPPPQFDMMSMQPHHSVRCGVAEIPGSGGTNKCKPRPHLTCTVACSNDHRSIRGSGLGGNCELRTGSPRVEQT